MALWHACRMVDFQLGEAHDRLARVLHTLRMRSTFYCHNQLGEPWGLEMPAIADAVSFHAVTSGSCWLRLPGAAPVELRSGDLALVPHGRGHDLTSDLASPVGPRADLLPQQYLSPRYSVLQSGGDGRKTQLICCIVTFDGPAARELMRTLPATLVVGEDTPIAAFAIRDTLRLMAGELAQLQPGGEAVATRLADILVVQAIRVWLTRDAPTATGWLAALQDDRVGLVMEAIHQDPGNAWNLDALARIAAMSRSAFSARFTALVGESPMTYLTRWRMNIAHSRLLEEGMTVSRVAGDLGYQSEAAFSRAFSRITGQTPGSVRRLGSQ